MKTFVNNFNQLPEVVLRKWLNRLIHFWFAKLLLFARWVILQSNQREIGFEVTINSTVSLQALFENQFLFSKKPPGRPEKLSKKDKRLIIRSVENDPKTTLQRIRVKYNSFATSKSVSRSTIRRVLKKYGLVSRVAAKKFQLNKKQRTTRKKWCLRMSKKPLGFLSSLALTEKST